MPHHAPGSGSEPSSAGRVALGTAPHGLSCLALLVEIAPGKSASQLPSQQASQSARAAFYPDDTKPCTLSQALSITCRNQSAATDPGPLLITALYVLRRTNFYREGIPCRCTQQLAGRAPTAPVGPLPFSS